MSIIHYGFLLPEEFCEYRRPSKTRHWVSTEGFWDYFFLPAHLLTKGMKMWIVFRCDNPCQFWRTRSAVRLPLFHRPSYFTHQFSHVACGGWKFLIQRLKLETYRTWPGEFILKAHLLCKDSGVLKTKNGHDRPTKQMHLFWSQRKFTFCSVFARTSWASNFVN